MFHNYLESAAYTGSIVALSLTIWTGNANGKSGKFDAKVVREKDHATYKATEKLWKIDSLELECELPKALYFLATIPTSIKTEKYYFSLVYDFKEFRYHLYNR